MDDSSGAIAAGPCLFFARKTRPAAPVGSGAPGRSYRMEFVTLVVGCIPGAPGAETGIRLHAGLDETCFCFLHKKAGTG